MSIRERDISQQLAEREGGECEVRTPVGSIDVLTARYVYEVKVAHQWKAALGQVLAYAQAYPDRKPRLYLYGDTGGMTKTAITAHCRAAGVAVVWHRDEDIPPRAAKPPEVIADHMRLALTVIDSKYDVRCSSQYLLPTPTAPIAREQLDDYADQALATFDVLLSNALTIKVSAAFQGEAIVIERSRPAVTGTPVYCQLHLTLRTSNLFTPLRASFAGARRELFEYPGAPGLLFRADHARRNLPVLEQLKTLMFHPEFPWLNAAGHRAVSIEKAIYRKYGLEHTRAGYRIKRG